MTIYAYARVSTTDQNLERQLHAFFTFGIEEKRNRLSRENPVDSFIVIWELARKYARKWRKNAISCVGRGNEKI